MVKQILLLALALLPIAANADTVKINDIYYYLDSETKQAYVTRNPNKYMGHVIIPASVLYDQDAYSVTNIGESAFEGCSDLTSVSIPNSVTTIGNYAFSGCSGLQSIVVDENNTVFDSRRNSNAIIKTATNTLILGCKNTIIPNSITAIGGAAFYDCSELTSITIPYGVTSIGSSAFRGCTSLISITIPESVTQIGGATFAECSSLHTIKLPNSITTMGERVFSDCISLTSITLPNSITYIPFCGFWGCKSLTSIIIPENITSIRVSAFDGCGSLKYVIMPKSITSVGIYAFSDCSSLTDVYCYAEQVPSIMLYPGSISTSLFDGLPKNATLHVPASTITTYRSAEGWDVFKWIIPINDTSIRQIELSPAGYATFYDSQMAYILPQGLTADVVSGINGEKIIYETIAKGINNEIVPERIAVVLKSEQRQAGTYTLVQTNAETNHTGENLLCGSDEATMTTADGNNYFYKLAYGAAGTDLANVFGWYWGAANGGSFLIEGHKAWLAIPKEQAHKIRAFSIEGDATAIADLQVETSEAEIDNSVYYDLQGRRINQPTRNGIYIRNGKKVAFAK